MELLTGKGVVFKVSDSDTSVLDYKWQACKRKNKTYIYTCMNGKKTYLHRFLMKPEGKLMVDHINHDGTDNTRENLRIVSRSINNAHSRNAKVAKSGYRGVYKNHAHDSTWSVVLNSNGHCFRWFGFRSKEEAAFFYNGKALEIYGALARLNDVELMAS